METASNADTEDECRIYYTNVYYKNGASYAVKNLY